MVTRDPLSSSGERGKTQKDTGHLTFIKVSVTDVFDCGEDLVRPQQTTSREVSPTNSKVVSEGRVRSSSTDRHPVVVTVDLRLVAAKTPRVRYWLFGDIENTLSLTLRLLKDVFVTDV